LGGYEIGAIGIEHCVSDRKKMGRDMQNAGASRGGSKEKDWVKKKFVFNERLHESRKDTR